MSKTANYKDRVAGFKDRVTTDQPTTPIQKVVPIKAESTQKEEIQLGVFISKELMKKLKVKAAMEDKTVKDIVNEILEQNV